MSIPNQVVLMGSISVLDAADVADKDSLANVVSAGRLGDEGIGKHAGMVCLRKNGTDDYDLVIATGSAPTDKWILFEAGSIITPS